MTPYRRLTPLDHKVQRLRAWLDDATDEKVVGAALWWAL